MAKLSRPARGLPSPIAASLGRLIARWSYLEWLLAQVLYQMCGVGPKIGRVAMPPPRASDYPARLQQVASILKLDLSPFPWSAYEKTLRELKEERDRFAHSIWLKDRGEKAYRIQDVRGSWQPDPTMPSVSKRIMPHGRTVTSAELNAIRRRIEGAIKNARELSRFVSISLQVAAQNRQRS